MSEFGGDRIIVYIDCGGGYEIAYVHHMYRTVTLNMVNFTLCKLYVNKTSGKNFIAVRQQTRQPALELLTSTNLPFKYIFMC